jgi:hypothetical protein
MSRIPHFGAVAAIVTAGLALALVLPAAPPADAAAGRGSVARGAFHDAMRKLWEDHIVWTRQYIVSAATLPGDMPDIGPTTDRLLANQVDIGNALKQFYGDKAGDRVTALLREHILTAARLVAEAKAGNGPGVADASADWHANGDEIAAYLHSLNPRHWPLDHTRAMMRAHLDRTLEEAVARLEGRYADDIAAYEAIQRDILDMADMLSDGIVRQFPGRFGR